MLKRFLKFTAFLCLGIIVCSHAAELFLSYFILFPMLLIPLLLFLEETARILFAACVICVFFIFIYFSILHPGPDVYLFGGLQFSIVYFFMRYRKRWAAEVDSHTNHTQASLAELEALKQKHQSRLESLHHLEKQVAGLLDLFEIARDFNDCLSLEGIASILLERVKPELSFHQMLLIVLSKQDDQKSISRIIHISDKGVDHSFTEEHLTYANRREMEAVSQTKKFSQKDKDLAFPIIIDGQVGAYLLIETVNADDLAKFEVLAAYLALQIKKVGLYEAVRELSIKDGLTGVFVRRHFMERFDEELKRSIKYSLPLAVLMLDIDHFKRYNDAHGHLAGDATLKQVAQLLVENLRRLDIVARYGGEEFIIVTPETRKAEAMEVAERIRSSVARHIFKVYQDQSRVTVSLGVSIYPDDVPEPHLSSDHAAMVVELIHRADQALYRAKEEGRNRVIAYQEL